MRTFKKCIVTWIDLIGITEKIENEKQEALDLMEKFRNKVQGWSDNSNHHMHAYTLNDSAILLGYITGQEEESVDRIITEITDLKANVDIICPSFAIAVKGTTFKEDIVKQPLVFEAQIEDGPKYINIKASSIAFANIFEIEKKLKNHKMCWYIDDRIVSLSSILRTPDLVEEVKLMPSRDAREIHMYKNSCLQSK